MATQIRFAPFHRLDPRAVVLCSAIIVAVLAAGFGYDMATRTGINPLNFPWYIHLHAIAFSGWLILLVAQVVLVRSRNVAQHRRMGRIAVVLLPLLLVTGPLAPILKNYYAARPDPDWLSFMATQFTNVIGCVTLLTAGLLFRRDPPTHKRLMLMGTIAITEPGFGRLIYAPLYAMLGEGYLPYYIETYGGTLTLMLTAGAYDLWTRGRPHPAWAAAFGWIVANQALASWLFYQPFWLNWMRVLTGH